MKDKFTLPQLFSDPCLARFAKQIEQPADRATMLKQIESGELAAIEFDAIVFVYGPNRNHLSFYEQDLSKLASSFKDKPFLRDHDQLSLSSRDGLIKSSRLVDGKTIEQKIQLTTRQGMTDYVEGRIDRFSIAWDFEDIHCSICKISWFACSHVPGKKYNAPGSYGGKTGPSAKEILCELIFTKPIGKETSAVNTPAVDGTSILAALNSFKEKNFMNKKDTEGNEIPAEDVGANGVRPQTPDPLETQLNSNLAALQTLNGEQQRQARLQEQITASDKLLAEQCKYLLNSALTASRLPEVTQARLRKSFEGTVFQPAQLQTAIDEARTEISALTAPLSIQGPGRIHGMVDSADQLQCAADDLLGAPRDADKVGLKIARLSGIRELYLMLTGDYDLHGGFDPLRAQLATTADFTGLVKNALNKVIVASFETMGWAGYDWWKQIVKVEHFTNLNLITGVLVGTIGSLPSVAEQAEYTELPVGDSPETASFTKYGGYLPLTLEAIDRDETRKLRLYAVELGNAAMRNISEQIAYIFTQSSGAGSTMADTGALFNAVAVATKGGHKNLLTTALGTDYTAWEAVAQAVYNQPMLVRQDTGYYGTGKKLAIDPKFCLVPRKLKGQAEALFVPRWASAVQTTATAGGPTYGGIVVPVTVPEWTDDTDWAAVCDPNIAPSIIVGERFGLIPEVYIAGNETDPAVFMNDEHRMKVRQFLAICVGDFRPLHKSNVAG